MGSSYNSYNIGFVSSVSGYDNAVGEIVREDNNNLANVVQRQAQAGRLGHHYPFGKKPHDYFWAQQFMQSLNNDPFFNDHDTAEPEPTYH